MKKKRTYLPVRNCLVFTLIKFSGPEVVMLIYFDGSVVKHGKTNYSLGPKRNYQVGGDGPKLCGSECRARKYGKLWDASTQTPWYRFEDPTTGMYQQGYYDDARSVALKYALAVGTNRSVSGLFIWPLNGNSLSTAPWAWETLVNAVGLKPSHL